ncbi:MAG TPA: N-acetylmuramoyl-L-alanine amidase [Candidatus Angelobacter sp.]
MRWTRFRTWRAVLGTALLLLCCTLLLCVADSQRQLTVYTPQKSFAIAVQDHEGQLYFNVLDLMTALTSASLQAKGKEWKLIYNAGFAVFTEGSENVKIRGGSVNLGGKTLAQDHTLLVPLNSSSAIISALLKLPAELHPDARRLFIDNATTHFTVELKKSDRPSLLLSFDHPVSPAVSEEGIKIQLSFRREPVISDINNQLWEDKSIHSLAFSEDNGAAFLTVTGAPGLTASVASDGRSIVIQAPAPPSAASAPAPAPTAESPSPAAAAPVPQLPAGNQSRSGPAFFVMIDAGHGGDDAGARLSSKLAEKDVTLSLARKIKAELQERGVVVRMVRDADVGLSIEQRAEATNEQRAAAYVAIHAGTPGGGVRVYVPAFTPSGPASGKFLTWENAQENFLPRSRVLARGIAGELEKKHIGASVLGTPLRPLNNINAPAIAIELAADPDNVLDMTDQKFQTTVATAIAVGIAQLRGQLEGQE